MATLPTALSPIPPPSTASSAANTYTDLHGLAALKNSPNSPEAIRAVSQQVEALFLQMMLKSMRDAGAAGAEPESNETSMYQDMFDKQVALTLSKHEDLGLSRLFERQLGPKAGPGSAASPSASLPPPNRETTPRAGGDGQRQASDGSAGSAEHAAQFVAQVLPTIRRAAGALGVNPLELLAQAALETGWGQRMPRTPDGSPSLK